MGRKHPFIGGIIGAAPLVTPPTSIDVLVVGGGSARTKLLSNVSYASGGNGGSVVRRTSFEITPSVDYAVTIGAGATSVNGVGSENSYLNASGGASSFETLTAAGGVGLNSNHIATADYTNKTSADIDGVVSSYSAASDGGTLNTRGARGSGAGGSATATVPGAAYEYAVNGTDVNTSISAGGDWNQTSGTASSVSTTTGTPYGRGGQGGYSQNCPGGDGVVYVAYPSSSISSYGWTGAASDLTPITSVAGYTVLQITGDGNFSVTE